MHCMVHKAFYSWHTFDPRVQYHNQGVTSICDHGIFGHTSLVCKWQPTAQALTN